MNSRERILSAINHKQPDRVPVDLGATGSSGMSKVSYQNLINFLGKGHLKNRVYDVVQELSQPDMELLDLFGVIEKISILGKDGGYMIAPAHILQNDVSPERVLKFIELCH